MEQSAVIKSKVDISRNLNGYSFPHKLSSQEAEIIIQKVKNIFSDSKYDFTLHKINELSQSELDLLEERELMDDEFLINANGALLFNSDKTICILINGLDHIKIQVIGYNDIKGLYKIANEMVISAYRKETSRNHFEQEMIYDNEPDLSPEDEILFKELASSYARALEQMPEKQRVVFAAVELLDYISIASGRKFCNRPLLAFARTLNASGLRCVHIRSGYCYRPIKI